MTKTQIWSVSFGVNTDSCRLVATSVEDAIKRVKAHKRYGKNLADNLAGDYWISSVELVAEAEF